MIIDTHTHLYAEEFNADRTSLIKKAIGNGVQKFYLPNIDSTSIEGMHQLEEEFPGNCFAMMGLHPCSVNATVESELAIVESWLKKRSYKAIGEIGIDLYWDKTFLMQQQQAFSKQIQWALDYHLPIVIHCRDAFDEIYEIVSSFKILPKAIFHCFSGNTQQANKIIELGNFKLGIGGVVTFKNSGLDKVVENIALEHLVLETDAPYLAPVPFRGKRNEPSYILEVARKVAQIKNCSLDEVAEITGKNAMFIFEKG
ncbi:MAG: TatD family hydrolase [Bacteroidetes bacterium]|nr:TatD family hydrolase [Bacteroidota bacterium]